MQLGTALDCPCGEAVCPHWWIICALAGCGPSPCRDTSAPGRCINVQNYSDSGASLELLRFTMLERMFWKQVTKINPAKYCCFGLCASTNPKWFMTSRKRSFCVSVGTAGWLGRASLLRLLSSPSIWRGTEVNREAKSSSYTGPTARGYTAPS